jgi:hypothetical protein
VSNYLSPPITVIFVAALCLKADVEYEPAAFVALVVGSLVGLARLVCHVHFKDGEDGKGSLFTTMNYLHFALLVTAITAVTFAVTHFLLKRWASGRKAGSFHLSPSLLGHGGNGGSGEGSGRGTAGDHSPHAEGSVGPGFSEPSDETERELPLRVDGWRELWAHMNRQARANRFDACLSVVVLAAIVGLYSGFG